MKKPNLHHQLDGSVKDLFSKPEYKARRKELNYPSHFDDYKKERDMVILDTTPHESSKLEIKEKYEK